MKTVVVGGVRYATNLFWQGFEDRKTFRDRARRMSTELDSDLIVFRVAHDVFQAGFANTADGGLPGLPSLACALAGTGDESLLIAFPLEDGQWYLLASRDGSILPEGDLLGDEQEIRRAFESYFSIGGWVRIIGPEDWVGRVDDITSFIQKQKRVPVTTPASKKTLAEQLSITPKMAFTLGSLLIVGVIAIYFLQQRHARLADLEAQRAHRIEMDRKRAELLANFSVPWQESPDPLVFIRACQDEATRLPATPAGWRLIGFSCNERSVEGRYIKMPRAYVSTLKSWYPEASVSDQGATLTHDLSLPARQDRDPTFLAAAKRLMLIEERQMNIEQIAERIDASWTVESEIIPMPNDPETGEPMMAPNAPVMAMRFQIEGRLPSSVMSLLSKGNGVTFQKFETDLRTGKSTIEGVMYGRIKSSGVLR